MKNVAKCDTWCELQNPVNHRVFERKLRPKPLGRGHVCLGVTHLVTPSLTPRGTRAAEDGPPCHSARPAQTRVPGAGRRDDVVVELSARSTSRPERTNRRPEHPSRPQGPSNATPGQAGLPAEFKHINKRRKRN
ncbi:hypothetical protein Sjap_026044 [Stephania japonica]|uniref:Uncharacterized protein n=1 Tax=Stephania japonica TaxID=461633 RepID=A0AAP0HEQ8_9MAGN